MGVIYKTTNLINGKIYVGKDKYNNPNYLGSGKILKKAISKYGLNNFKKEILEYCETQCVLNDREVYWIDELKSTNKSIGYNIVRGGVGGAEFSERVKNKISETSKGRKRTDDAKRKFKETWRLKMLSGFKFSDKTLQRMSISRIGRKISEETRIKYRQRRTIKGMKLPSLSLKRKQDISISSKERIWINNGTDEHFIKFDILVEYQNQGYKTGRLRDIIMTWSKTNKGKPLSQERKIQISKENSKRAWIKNGTEESFVEKDSIEGFISDGYVVGRIGGSVWINDGNISKMVDRKSLDSFLNNGFVLGRLSFKHQKGVCL